MTTASAGGGNKTKSLAWRLWKPREETLLAETPTSEEQEASGQCWVFQGAPWGLVWSARKSSKLCQLLLPGQRVSDGLALSGTSQQEANIKIKFLLPPPALSPSPRATKRVGLELRNNSSIKGTRLKRASITGSSPSSLRNSNLSIKVHPMALEWDWVTFVSQ